MNLSKCSKVQMLEALQWIVEGYIAGEDIHGPKVAHGIAEARTILDKTGVKQVKS